MNESLRKRMTLGERGTAATEFVMFLPIFITIFAGMVNLAKFNMATTQVQLNAQQKMWDRAIAVASSGPTQFPEHSTTIGAAGASGTKLGGYAANSNNDQRLADTAEGVVMAGLLTGHWGESYLRVKPFHLASIAEKEPKLNPKDVIGKQPFPNAVLNDGLNTQMPDGVVDIVVSLLTASGAVHAVGAGIRWGTAFGEESKSFSVGRVGNYNASAHYDVLVPPSPLKGAGTKVSFALAWALAQTEDNYYNLLIFGDGDGLEASGGSTSGGMSGIDLDGALEDMNEDLDEASDEKDTAEEAEEERKRKEAEAAANGGG